MKRTFWLLSVVTVMAISLMSAVSPVKTALKDDSEGIQFTDATWNSILKKAKTEKKIIFLDAYASWCGPCKMLQKNVFTRREVGDYFNKRFINVKMDMEKGEGPLLSQRYPLEAYPTLLFIDGNGRVVKKVIGYQDPEKLLAIGKSVKESGI